MQKEIKTPVPGLKHNCCTVCNLAFKEGAYKEHIASVSHAECVRARQPIYNDIDALITQMNEDLFAKQQSERSSLPCKGDGQTLTSL